MDLEFSENQVALDNLIGKLCQRYCTTEHVRKAEDESGMCSELWHHMLEAGTAGLIVPEEMGGLGFSLLDATVAYEQLGRHLAATPHFSSSVVSVLMLTRATNSEAATTCLENIANGSTVVSPAWLEPDGGFSILDVNLQATPVTGGYLLNGVKVHVPYVVIANKFLVLARTSEDNHSLKLFLVEGDSKGLQKGKSANLAGDAQGRLVLRDVFVSNSDSITPTEDGGEIWNEALNEAVILDAAYAAGLADRALEITVDYAKEREQFGTPIGAFQAISHPLVNNKVSINGAKALIYEAAWAHSAGESYRALAMMAALFAKNTAREVTARAEQVHGGIGFTIEYDIQLFYRRAKQMQVNWYDKRTLESTIAQLTFDEGEAWSGPDPFEPDSNTISALSS